MIPVTMLDPKTAFTGIGLDAWLETLGVTQVVIAGVATSIGRIFPRLGETGTTAAIVELLDRPDR